jgi:hypothetical protein
MESEAVAVPSGTNNDGQTPCLFSLLPAEIIDALVELMLELSLQEIKATK